MNIVSALVPDKISPPRVFASVDWRLRALLPLDEEPQALNAQARNAERLVHVHATR